MEVFDDGPGQAESVERARAPPDFVQDDQAARRGIVQEICCFAHLDHECGLAAREIVAGADAREDAIDEVDARLGGRDKGAGVGEQRQQRHLPDIGALARHVRPGDEHDLRFLSPLPGDRGRGGTNLSQASQVRVVRHEPFFSQRLVEHRMTSLADAQHAFVAHLWTATIEQPRGFGK